MYSKMGIMRWFGESYIKNVKEFLSIFPVRKLSFIRKYQFKHVASRYQPIWTAKNKNLNTQKSNSSKIHSSAYMQN